MRREVMEHFDIWGKAYVDAPMYTLPVDDERVQRILFKGKSRGNYEAKQREEAVNLLLTGKKQADNVLVQMTIYNKMNEFDDDEEENQEVAYSRTLNGMVDTLLRGSGLPGAVVATAKNIIL